MTKLIPLSEHRKSRLFKNESSNFMSYIKYCGISLLIVASNRTDNSGDGRTSDSFFAAAGVIENDSTCSKSIHVHFASSSLPKRLSATTLPALGVNKLGANSSLDSRPMFRIEVLGQESARPINPPRAATIKNAPLPRYAKSAIPGAAPKQESTMDLSHEFDIRDSPFPRTREPQAVNSTQNCIKIAQNKGACRTVSRA